VKNTHCTLDATVKSGSMSFARFSPYDFAGQINGYVGEGAFTNIAPYLGERCG